MIFQMARLSLRAVSICLACVGLIEWTSYAAEGLFRVHFPYWSSKTDWSDLVYQTFFCTPKKRQNRLYETQTFCICQLILYSIFLVGALKVQRLLLWICWLTLVILQLERIYKTIYSGCSFSPGAIFYLLYATLEIWIVFRFVSMQKKGATDGLNEQSPTIQNQLNIREIQSHEIYNLNNLQAVSYCIAPVASARVASAPAFTNGNSITSSCPQITEGFHSLTDSPPTYEDSISNTDHQSINLDSIHSPLSNTKLSLDTSTDLPPSYIPYKSTQ